MSIRAMNWAMGARTDGVSAQCVLYVVADTANEHGVSIHADPDYIAGRTRQSRATVFRRLKELEAAGALTRFKRFREDGAPVYEIRLHLEVEVDYDATPDVEGSAQDIEGESQSETQAGSQFETGGVAPVRQAESQSCDSKNPSKNPEDSPQAPLRGVEGQASPDQESEADQTTVIEGWEEFKSSFEADGVPILRVSIAKGLFAALSWPDERKLVTKAAKGLLAHRARDKKPGAKPSAQTFIREIEAWPGYAKLAPPEPLPRIFIAEHSSDALALRVLHTILDRATPECRMDVERGVKGFWRFGIVPLDLAGLATFTEKPLDQWSTVEENTKPFFAWCERIERWTGHRPEPQRIYTGEVSTKEWNGKQLEFRKFVLGFRVPCLYPPRKDGTISPDTTDPPGDPPS